MELLRRFVSPPATQIPKSSCTVPDICPLLTKFKFYRQIFMKVPPKFHENPSSGRRADTSGETDARDIAKRRSYDYTTAPKNESTYFSMRATLSARCNVHDIIIVKTPKNILLRNFFPFSSWPSKGQW